MPGPPAPKEAREERLQARGYGTRERKRGAAIWGVSADLSPKAQKSFARKAHVRNPTRRAGFAFEKRPTRSPEKN